MSKKAKIIISSVIITILSLGIFIGVFAYYEFYGQYSAILNIDGTIKLDAFDVLYPEMRGHKVNDESTYGTTPENPYVIDNVTRLNNLIRLNNSGKLARSKAKAGVDKYYFCLEFDEQELEQVLNLQNEGVFSSIGNNEYPFSDELSGIVYSNGGNYYSGCLEKITLTTATEYNGTNYPAGTYYKLPVYGSDHTITSYNYVAEATFDSDYTKVHQIIANETIEVDDTQMDIGFISRIAETGNVHDLILYNISINCEEETPQSFFDVLKDIVFGTSHSHANESATKASDERHIGIFAGHIDGSASNISVAGTSLVNINSKKVNYYSNYTTVGFISDNAYIGGNKISSLISDSFLNGGSVSGCLFADNIYKAVVDQSVSVDSTNSTTGANYYKLVEVAADSSVGWPGLEESDSFTYGAFTFMLSSRVDDALSTIWSSADKTKKLLGLTDSQYTAYVINQSVLYCSNEYRFSGDQTEGGSIIRSSASVAQGLYAGVRTLDNGGSVIDAGKYLIVAKMQDTSRTGGYAYYALKLTIDADGQNLFDTSDAIDITNYILDTSGNEKVYQSCVWEVETASSSAIFKNNRWDENYLKANISSGLLNLEDQSVDATAFQVNMTEDKFYYTSTTDGENTIYYLNFNIGNNYFYLSTESETNIQLYRISNGYNLQQISSASDIVETGDYVIVARSGDNSYLLGIDYTFNSETQVYQTSNEYAETLKTYTTVSFPTSLSLSEYNEIINSIWYVDEVASGISFIDKVSMTYHISNDGTDLTLATAIYWTYSGTTSGSLSNDSKYISFDGSKFTLSNSSYTLYLYRLVPQDETPLYISYEGAKHLEANSTELKAGDYVIVANVNGNRYPLGLTNATTIDNNSGNTITPASYSPTDSYIWTISLDTYNPRFINKQHGSYNLYTNGTALSSSQTSFTWYYDAIESRLYTEVEGTPKYLSYDTTNGFIISDTVPTVKIELYKNEVQHDLTDITLLTSTANNVKNSFQTTTTSNRWYFISYYDITDTNYSPVLVEWNDKDPLDHRTNRNDVINYDRQWNGSSDNYVMNENPYIPNVVTNYELVTTQPANWNTQSVYSTYYKITANAGTRNNHNWAANTWYSHVGNQYILEKTQPANWNTQSVYSTYYRITATAGAADWWGNAPTWAANTWYSYSLESGSISTTDGNLLKALWGFETDTFSVNSQTGNQTYDWLYNKYFQDNYEELGYTTATARYTQSYNNYTHNHLGGYELGKLYLSADDSMDKRSKGVTTSKSVRIVPNYNSGFLPTTANSRVYIQFAASTNNVKYTLAKKESNGVLTFQTENNLTPSNDQQPYIYSCDYNTSYKLTLISSDGDKLDNTINYVIAAKSGNKYYGLTYDSTNASDGYTGTDVTTYVNPIMNATGEVIKETVNVPKNCDWTCTASNSENMFYQTATSTNNTKYYIDSSGTTLTQSEINTGASTASVLKMYYDTINKVMKCIKNSTTYYLTYDSSTNKFGLSTNSASAAQIHLFRYDASYTVSIVTNYNDYDKCLMDGDFIIASHSVDGWTALGSNGSSAIKTDVTNKLTDTISEEDYKSLLDYIYHQYQYTSEGTFNSNVSSDYFIFNNFNLSETGSIAYKGNTSTTTYLLVGDAAPYKWKVSRFDDGTWKLVNNQAIGNGDSEGQAAMNFTQSNATSSLTINQSYKAVVNYLSMASSGSSQVAIFNYSGGALGEQVKNTSATGTIDFTLDNQYVILMMNSSKVWYLIGIENHTIKTQIIGKSLSTDVIKSHVDNNNTYVLKALDRGTNNYGYSLQFVSDTSYYLAGSNQVTASTTKTYLEYYYNNVYTDQSKLQVVQRATASGNLNVDGNKITATNDAITYLYDTSTSEIATTLTNEHTYAILIFKDFKYYIVSVNNANNVVPATYGSGLPSTFAANELWYYDESRFSSNSDHTKYLGMAEDGGLALLDTVSTGLWTYSGNTMTSPANFSNTYYTGSSVGINNNYGICLFYVRKSDALSATADVESSLNYKAEVISSLSVMDSENYIIVAEYNGRYYALTMKTKDAPITIDITDEFEDALSSGSTITLYDASVWEQLGKDYSLIFSNNGFSEKYEENNLEYVFNSAGISFYDYTVNGSVITLGSQNEDPQVGNNYVMVYSSDGHNYTYMMGNNGVCKEKDYESSLPTTIQKDEIWTYYSYSDNKYTMTPHDAIIYLKDYYLLSGDPTERTVNGEPTTIVYDEMPEENENYIWTLYTYGNNQYVIGNYDSNYGQIYYLYFDYSSFRFQFTTDIETAKENNKKVQVYRLGEKLENTNNYQTFEISMNDDGFTIDSLPLTEITEATDIVAYGGTPASGTIEGVVNGEYVVMAKVGDNYYALTCDESGNIMLADLSLMFSGNFLIDTNGNYCLTINSQYIWKQTATPSYSGKVVSGLKFQNYVYDSVTSLKKSSSTISLTGLTYDLDNHRLYNGSTYITFSRSTGYTISNTYNDIAIYFYSLGVDGIAIDKNSDIIQYTYYSFALNTSAVDYSYFIFNRMLIPDLPNVELDEANIIVQSRGWKKSSTSIIEEVNNSIYFKEGININENTNYEVSSNLDTFSNQFEEVEYSYTLNDESKTEKEISYYAPKGAASMVITEASPENPVFVNVIVSTELDSSFDETKLRYLALWKIADLTADTATLATLSDYSDDATNSVKDYAYSLVKKFYKPNAAIPLPNCYSTATTQSSYVKVSTPNSTDTEVYYLKYINYEHLLAHTYTITSPGVYYLGATYGTVTICYMSIDNMMAAEEGEDNTNIISEDFSIDFVWGDLGNTGDFGSDDSVGDITYVGRKETNDEAHTWVHSNIYPKFVNGDSSNPTDYLYLDVSREYVETVGISTVTVNVRTDSRIYDDGLGIMYLNSNSSAQRAKRKLEFNITIDSIDEGTTSMIISKNVVSFGDSTKVPANSITTGYYKGTQAEWANVANNAAVQTVKYYSAKKPEENVGNYWYYNNDMEPTIWTDN